MKKITIYLNNDKTITKVLKEEDVLADVFKDISLHGVTEEESPGYYIHHMPNSINYMKGYNL